MDPADALWKPEPAEPESLNFFVCCRRTKIAQPGGCLHGGRITIVTHGVHIPIGHRKININRAPANQNMGIKDVA